MSLMGPLVDYTWTKFDGRPEQRTPPGDWRIWLILAGRGWGKTRTGAQDAAAYGIRHPGSRIAIVAPTFADARDTCVEGESGLLNVFGPCVVRTWNRSIGELILKNGTRYKLFSADEPERLRGPQHHRAWCDELAAWTRPEAFDQLQFGLRLGKDPRIVVTTTPKPLPLIKSLVARAKKSMTDVLLTRGRTADNVANLPATTLQELQRCYAGTRLGRQELEAEILDDASGALWRRVDIDKHRVAAAPTLARVVVALDPAMTAHANSDETGIIVAGCDTQGHAYVLADGSARHTPEGWAQAALALAETYYAAHIVAEVNAGGDLVARLLKSMGCRLPFRAVHAVKGKVGRALPIAAFYEQGRVHHVGSLAKLEDQLCRFTMNGYQPAGRDDSASPDRLDALVWAVTDLLLTDIAAAPKLKFL